MDEKKKLELAEFSWKKWLAAARIMIPTIMLRRLPASAAATSTCRSARPVPAAAQAKQSSSAGSDIRYLQQKRKEHPL